MRFSDAKGREVVATTTAQTVGRVAGFVIDPVARRVLALDVKKSASGDTVLWSDIVAFGKDAVTVTAADAIMDADDAVRALSRKDRAVLGKRVLTTAGEELGKVRDVEFDPDSGSVTALVLESGDVAGVRLVGAGSYAVVVDSQQATAAPPPRPAAQPER